MTDQQVTIVGEALFPSDVHATFDEGPARRRRLGSSRTGRFNEVDGVQRQVAMSRRRRIQDEVAAVLQASVGDQFADLGLL